VEVSSAKTMMEVAVASSCNGFGGASRRSDLNAGKNRSLLNWHQIFPLISWLVEKTWKGILKCDEYRVEWYFKQRIELVPMEPRGPGCFWQSKIPEHGSVDVHSTLTRIVV
jgi:hypothetical protein